MAGQVAGSIAYLHAMNVPVSQQIIVWVPIRRLPILSLLPSAIHRERQMTLGELRRFKLVCYALECDQPKPGSSSQGITPALAIQESGLQPDQWLLLCPSCGTKVGPDIDNVSAAPIVRRWESLGRPPLEHPWADPTVVRSGAPITDLPRWIEDLHPSHLELAYLGQQMWPDIAAMLATMTENVRPPK
jgi:hypothetical protein